MKIQNNGGYIDGVVAGRKMIKFIHLTEYKTLENAIRVKKELVELFEKEFGFSRDGEFDYNYAHSLGILDTLINESTNKQSNS